jgi:hypothetical protein
MVDNTAHEAEKAAQEAEELTQDMCTVKNELHRYKDDGSLSSFALWLEWVSGWGSGSRGGGLPDVSLSALLSLLAAVRNG